MIKDKILDLENLKRKVESQKIKSRIIVFTNGCFDILHPGHVQYLEEAKALGHFLVLGLNADVSVKKLNKGKSRPIQSQEARAMIMAALESVDAVIIFEEETPLNLIKAVNPDILVKGGDYKIEEVVGADFVKSNGGEVILIPFLEGYSTSSIEEKILSSNS